MSQPASQDADQNNIRSLLVLALPFPSLLQIVLLPLDLESGLGLSPAAPQISQIFKPLSLLSKKKNAIYLLFLRSCTKTSTVRTKIETNSIQASITT